jgi:hypothetical protein
MNKQILVKNFNFCVYDIFFHCHKNRCVMCRFEYGRYVTLETI